MPCGLLAAFLVLGGIWYLLPRESARTLDLVLIQPNFEAGARWPGMEQEMWARSDAELKARHLPRPGTATLLLWPESAVLGRNDLLPNPRLQDEARRRGIAWLFGTEGGLYNLVRGEAGGRPSFVQAKRDPHAFRRAHAWACSAPQVGWTGSWGSSPRKAVPSTRTAASPSPRRRAS